MLYCLSLAQCDLHSKKEQKEKRAIDVLLNNDNILPLFLPLFLPRLSERGKDIEVLTWRFIEEFNKLKQRVISSIDESAIEALYAYSWPENIRELRNNIEYAFVMGLGCVLRLDDLTPEVRGEPAPVQSSGQSSLRHDEIHSIRDALRRSKNKRAEAAEKLGMSRATLWRKIREYDFK